MSRPDVTKREAAPATPGQPATSGARVPPRRPPTAVGAAATPPSPMPMPRPSQSEQRPPEQPQRALRDVLEGRVRITLAGTEYVLPVLTIGENADWKASLDDELAPIVTAEDDLSKVVGMLEKFSGRLLDFIRSYDVMGVLPSPGDWERDIYPHELLRAVMEVRLATDPSSRYALAMSRAVAPKPMTTMDRVRSVFTNSWRRPTAGRSARFGPN